MNVFLKLTAVLLTAAMTFGFAQPRVYAAMLPEETVVQETAETADLSEIPDGEAGTEDISKRTENSKHFFTSAAPNGEAATHEAVVYPFAVHYLKDGKWEDIDNRLQRTVDESGQVRFENVANDFRVSLAADAAQVGAFRVSCDEFFMAWSMPDAASTAQIQVAEKAEMANMRDSAALSENLSAAADYRGILPQTDLQYTLTGKQLKENIVVRARADQYVYSFDLHIENAAPLLQENGEIVVRSKNGDGEFTIQAPYMTDASGARSEAVTYALERTSKYDYRLIVTADAAWINRAETQFPVTIDPTVTASNSAPEFSNAREVCSKTGNSTTMGYPEIYNIGAVENCGEHWVEFTLNTQTGREIADTYDTLVGVYVNLWFELLEPVALKDSQGNLVDIDISTNNIVEGKYGRASFDIIRLFGEAYNQATSYTGTFSVHRLFENSHGGKVYLTDNYGSYVDEDGVRYIYNYPFAPSVSYYYNSCNGISDKYSYQTSSIGSGAGYVNRYSGEMTYVLDLGAVSDQLLSLPLLYVYSTESGKWKLSPKQSCTTYGYTDGLGAYHPFVQKNGSSSTYIDLDGLGLTYYDATSRMTTKAGITYTFNESHYLTVVEDRGGNRILIYWQKSGSDANIYRIVDASQRKYTFTYRGTDLLSMTRPDGTQVTFTYTDSGALSSVTDNGNTTSFTYDGNKITAVSDSVSGLSLHYTYDSRGRVTQILEKAGTVSGQAVQLVYHALAATDVTTSGKDDILGTDDDITVTYQFDRYGRHAAAYSVVDGQMLALTSAYYSADANSTYAEIRKNNKSPFRTPVVEVGKSNDFPNFSFENNGGWSSYSWTEDSQPQTPDWSIDSSTHRSGSKSGKLYSSSAVDRMDVVFHPVTCPDDTMLTVYVKTENFHSDYGIYVGDINALMRPLPQHDYSNGAWVDVPATTDGWQKITVKVPQNGGILGFGARKYSGSIWFDDMCFGESSSQNLLANSSFGNEQEHNSWQFTDANFTTQDGRDCLSIPTDEPHQVSQTIPIGRAGISSFFFSGWMKAKVVPSLAKGLAELKLEVSVKYADGTYASNAVRPNRMNTDWQFLADTVSVNPDKVVQEVTYECYSVYLYGEYLYLDDACLMITGATELTYDDEGNVISARTPEKDTTSAEYNALQKVSALTDAFGESYSYTYDAKGNLTRAESDTGMQIDVTNNSKGLPTNTVVSASTPPENSDLSPTAGKLYTSASYYSVGGYLSTLTDNNGTVTSYNYNTQNGQLLSVYTSAHSSQPTRYAYNAFRQVEAVYRDMNNNSTRDATDPQVSYTYNANRRLSQIHHNNFDYNLYYDVFGNMTSLAVAGNTLAAYAYAPNNGKLRSVTYGNGYSRSYEYDLLGRVVAQKQGNTVRESFTYDLRGNLLTAQNAVESLTFSYDDSDRLQSSVHRFGNQRLNVSYTYGTGNRLERAVYDGSSLYGDYVYTYGENSAVKTVKVNNSTLLSYRYDTLGRRIQADIGSVVNAHYVYKNGSGGENATTTLVSTLVYPDRQYHFTYGENRAILSVERVQGSDTKTTAYAYDSMDQLIREDNPFAGKTYVYTYDLGGNLLTKTTYAYTQPNSTPNGPLSTVTYGYDSEWHDLLTSYDGSPITYDEIGNPLSYRGSTFVWNGRQLTQATKGNESMAYVYGVNGMRLQKTYATPTKTVTTAHSTDGAVIYADFEQTVENGETTNEYRAYFYDESGSPVGFMFHGQNYYFEKTLQGDISRIYDSEGNVVGEYLYDAWGNLLNADSLTEIAKQNPFRYRGYYFDSETGFYYLRSRYYDPQVGRWINADEPEIIDGGNDHILENNLFAYCFNNPVNMTDDTGYWPKWATKLLVGAAVIAVAAIVTVATGGAGAGVAGFIAAGVLKGAVIGGAIGAATGAAGGAINHRASTGSWEGAGKAALNGAADGFMTGAISGAITGGVGRATQVLRNTSVAGKLGKTGKPLSSQSIVKNGEVTNTRFYNIKGKATFQLDYTNHGFPKYHSIPHGHKINFSDPKPWSNPINNLWRSRW